MRGLRNSVLAVLILGTVLGMSFSAGAAGPDAPVPDRELVLGLRAAPPFAMKTPDGIWTGITVELWRHVAEQLSLRYRFEETAAEELFQGLADGRLDASAGGLGGCPFAPGATGNIATEDLVYLLQDSDIDVDVDLQAAITAAGVAKSVVGHDLPSALLRAGDRITG